jgi:hypothetical protein
MPKTKLEKEISRRSTRKGKLVPLLEDLFTQPVEIESEEDIEWIEQLLRRMLARGQDRNNRPLYSPSQLSECLRYVYLLKHRKELGLVRTGSRSASAHYYFFTGNFLHLKWQFALMKLEKAVNNPAIFRLHGVEVPIVSKRKDHGGTVDALVSINEEPSIVDFKGINVRSFQEISRGFVPVTYTIQLTDYGMLFNSAASKNGEAKISTALLVSENKGGADAKRPLALQETEIQIETHLPEVRSRLKELRSYADKKEIPPPECTSIGTVQFKACPFRKFCKEEVQVIERRAKRAARKDAEGLTVAIPERRGNNRSRRNSKR